MRKRTMNYLEYNTSKKKNSFDSILMLLPKSNYFTILLKVNNSLKVIIIKQMRKER